MVTLFSQEKVSEIHDYNLVKDAHSAGHAEGITIGVEKGEQNIIRRLLETLSPEQVAATLKAPIEDILKIAEGSRD